MKTIEALSDLEGKPERFRKRPVVVRAVQINEPIRILTREGEVMGEPGDFVIEGVEGEVYPCGYSIFQATYEPEIGHG